LTTDAVIMSVVVIDNEGGIFDTDTLIHTLQEPSSRAKVPLQPLKNVAASLSVQVHVGARPTSESLFVFEFNVTLPTFAMFVLNDKEMNNTPPQSSVNFAVGGVNFNRVVDWVEQSFILTDQLGVGAGGVQAKFTHLGVGDKNEKLWLQVKRDDKIKVKIGCDSMSVAGDVIQDLGKFLKLEELEAECNFPTEMAEFSKVLSNVTEFYSSRAKLTADMADSSQRVKALVVRAEDARILQEMRAMRSVYAYLYTLNNSLVGEYAARTTNHLALLGALKEVNGMINRASCLRIGRAKGEVVRECRKAIKGQEWDKLEGIICKGAGARR